MATFDKHLVFRCDDRIEQWIKQLAEDSGRSPSRWIRDVVYYLRITRAGGIINAALNDQGVHYRPIPKHIVDQPIIKPAPFPWGNLPDDPDESKK